ncbi:D-alanyl-D-alanine carboxypeptidase/D-alanyl-D-alanine-endopeptidase [Demequina sp.]|uniref:D-alanyl-D-alanine carboxypeptidase/D-alanyl-D-alanine endopeptidase n=1 Tax=Demequina sp. TaxID=2050685 RepID=UPI0025C419B5|nr:D-alanyl-D-alanine carboxypeptidase/D-alanyl-D-alanine-endopeptidase [Demequina sp.]
MAATLVPLTVVAALGGYAYADSADLVPGWITTSPEPLPPQPFLTASAVDPADAPGTDVWPLLDASAPVPDVAVLQGLAQGLRDDPRTGTSVNISVIDLITGDVLVDVDAADGQVPASTTKVLTAIAVVGAMGPDATLKTVATYDAARGEVVLVAGGDMLLAADAGNGADPVGFAGVGDLADQVAAALEADGVTRIKIGYDTSLFPGPAYPTEWPAYALRNGYAAPVTGLAVNVGKMTDDDYAQRWPDPAARAADVFAKRLDERGIAVTGVSARAGSAGVQVGVVESAPLSAVVEYMLHESDNTIAEVLTRVLAVHDGRRAVPYEAMLSVRAALGELGLDLTGLEIYDGAGFSVRNRIPPRLLAEGLRAAALAETTHDLPGWLAEAGLSGTLDDRFTSTPGAGVVRAKTGSLTGVTALSGIVFTQQGRPLTFAVLADGMPYGQDRPRAAIDAFVDALAQCGCQQ